MSKTNIEKLAIITGQLEQGVVEQTAKFEKQAVR